MKNIIYSKLGVFLYTKIRSITNKALSFYLNSCTMLQALLQFLLLFFWILYPGIKVGTFQNRELNHQKTGKNVSNVQKTRNLWKSIKKIGGKNCKKYAKKLQNSRKESAKCGRKREKVVKNHQKVGEIASKVE